MALTERIKIEYKCWSNPVGAYIGLMVFLVIGGAVGLGIYYHDENRPAVLLFFGIFFSSALLILVVKPIVTAVYDHIKSANTSKEKVVQGLENLRLEMLGWDIGDRIELIMPGSKRITGRLVLWSPDTIRVDSKALRKETDIDLAEYRYPIGTIQNTTYHEKQKTKRTQEKTKEMEAYVNAIMETRMKFQEGK